MLTGEDEVVKLDLKIQEKKLKVGSYYFIDTRNDKLIHILKSWALYPAGRICDNLIFNI